MNRPELIANRKAQRSALALIQAREAALTAAWEAFLSDVPMSWVRA